MTVHLVVQILFHESVDAEEDEASEQSALQNFRKDRPHGWLGLYGIDGRDENVDDKKGWHVTIEQQIALFVAIIETCLLIDI